MGPILGDIGMTILDPVVGHVLSSACFTVLKSIVDGGKMPATSNHLFQITRVFAATTTTQQQIQNQQFKALENPAKLTSRFYPTLVRRLPVPLPLEECMYWCSRSDCFWWDLLGVFDGARSHRQEVHHNPVDRGGASAGDPNIASGTGQPPSPPPKQCLCV